MLIMFDSSLNLQTKILSRKARARSPSTSFSKDSDASLKVSFEHPCQ